MTPILTIDPDLLGYTYILSGNIAAVTLYLLYRWWKQDHE
jgi:hypothetical protein